jgi:glycosyltransferase involved in cell wall biosynthesis
VTNFQDVPETTSRLKLQYNSVMARGDCIIAESKFAARRLSKLYPQAKGKVYVIPPGCDLRQFSPRGFEPRRVQELRTQWEIAPDERIILQPGTFGPGEKQDILIDAARLLVSRGISGIKFVFTGDFEKRSIKARELTKLIEKADLDKLLLIRKTPFDRPAAILAAALVVLPASKTASNDRAAIEAQAMGTPVIVADAGALPETVLAPPDVETHSRTGWRVPSNDPAALATAIGAVLGLGASAKDGLSQRARAHIENRYSHLRASTETLNIYKELMSRPNLKTSG